MPDAPESTGDLPATRADSPTDTDESTPRLKRPSWADRVQHLGAIELFEKYRRKVTHRETELPFDPAEKPRKAYTIESLAFETGLGMRLALKVFVPVCAVMFGLSFLWDWHGLIRSCSVAGMIGFATNWVAIKMLFWPRETRPIFGQGLIPSQRDQLIEKVADEVLENLINEELILTKIEEMRIVERLSGSAIEKLGQVIQDPEFKADIRRVILTWVAEITSNPEFRQRLADRVEQSVEDFAGSGVRNWAVRKLKSAWSPAVVRLLNREIEGLEETVGEGLDNIDEVMERFPLALAERQDDIDRVLSRMLVGLVREVDVREIVLEQLSTVTTEQLEQGFKEFSDDKLSFITLLGGLLGMVGGTVIVWPIPSIAVLAALGLTLLVLDLLAKPLMESRFWPRRRNTTRKSVAKQQSGTESPPTE
jgi:hypothetical protein